MSLPKCVVTEHIEFIENMGKYLLVPIQARKPLALLNQRWLYKTECS